MIYKAAFSDGTLIVSDDLKNTTIAYAWRAKFRDEIKQGFTSQNRLAHDKAHAAVAAFAVKYGTARSEGAVEVVSVAVTPS